jgi:hypothetical protein
MALTPSTVAPVTQSYPRDKVQIIPVAINATLTATDTLTKIVPVFGARKISVRAIASNANAPASVAYSFQAHDAAGATFDATSANVGVVAGSTGSLAAALNAGGRVTEIGPALASATVYQADTRIMAQNMKFVLTGHATLAITGLYVDIILEF